MSDFLSINDLTGQQIAEVLQQADRSRRGEPLAASLSDMSVALLFEKPSLRTRVSFDLAVHQLGGYALYLGPAEVGLGTREAAEDVARVLERYVRMIVARVFDHGTLERLAEATSIPVVNALSDREHPCQALADLLTIQQHFERLDGVTVAYVGDANNVACSLALACAATGVTFRIASPPGYQLSQDTLSLITARYRDQGSPAAVVSVTDPVEAVKKADAVYTDVWTSMGQEAEAAQRLKDFTGYQIDEQLLAEANRGALLMHPMPAHYGEEVAFGMLEHPQCVAYDQAENRLHVQKAVLQLLASSQ